MDQAERSRVTREFKESIELICEKKSQTCEGSVKGPPLSIQLSFRVGLLANPTMNLGNFIRTKMKLRNPRELMFCGIMGMAVQKYLVVKRVDGLHLKIENDQPKLVVDAGDDADNFNCD
jgi:hypothetical protein